MKYLLLTLALLALTACSTQTATKTGQTATAVPLAARTPAPSQPPAIRIFQPGDQILITNDADQTRVMLTVSQPTVIKPGQYDSAPKGEYLAVPVTVENQGVKPFTVSSMIGFEVRDQDGQGYTTAYLSSVPKAPDGEVAPTQKLAGTLVYDVTPGKTYQLLFKANFLSSGQAIVNLGAH